MKELKMSLIHEALQALEAMKAEFRALDLPYGSKAYAQANEVSYRLRAALADQPDAARTLMQDQSRGLSQWLASQPDARLHAREAAAVAQQGEAVAPANTVAAAEHCEGIAWFALCALVAAGHVSQEKADEAMHLMAKVQATKPAAAPQPVAQGDDYGVALLAAWDAVRDPGPAGDDVPHPVFAAGFKAGWSANAAAPAGVVGEPPTHEALTDAISEALQGTYHCLRVWSAWSVGTMGEDDFSPVDESDTPANIADLVMRLYTAPPARQALAQSEVDAIINASREADEGPTGLVRRTERAHGIGAV